ncbi:MAG: branched-chain amino acid ABC transporter permease [Oscillospiraceae bacterium]|jgi:branched-chain amino acid transport system permease protein
MKQNKWRSHDLLVVVERFCDKYKYLFLLVFLVVAYAVPFMGLSRLTMRILVMIALYSTLGMGLNVLVGYIGQVSLGHAGFFAIGAYTSALLNVNAGLSFWISAPLGACLAALIGLLLGLPTLRLSGTYLAIVTLGFCEVVIMVLKQWEPVTYGNYGVRNIPKPVFFGRELNLSNGGFYIIILTMALLTALVCHLIRNSKVGRAFVAIKEDELAATMMGIKTARYKILGFVMSAFITGFAGAFYSVINNGYIEPSNFTFDTSIMILSVVIVGGIGTTRGMIFGAALLLLFPEVFRFLDQWRFVIYGVLLVLMMQFRPQGALGWSSTLPYRLPKAVKAQLKARQERESSPTPTSM